MLYKQIVKKRENIHGQDDHIISDVTGELSGLSTMSISQRVPPSEKFNGLGMTSLFDPIRTISGSVS